MSAEPLTHTMKHHLAERAVTTYRNPQNLRSETKFKKRQRSRWVAGSGDGRCTCSSAMNTGVLTPKSPRRSHRSLKASALRVQKQEIPRACWPSSPATVMTPGLMRDPASNNKVQRRGGYLMSASALRVCTHGQARPPSPHTHIKTMQKSAKKQSNTDGLVVG